MCFYFENPYTGAILRFCLVACWTRRLYMESPQTVPKDTLLKQNTPGLPAFPLISGTFFSK